MKIKTSTSKKKQVRKQQKAQESKEPAERRKDELSDEELSGVAGGVNTQTDILRTVDMN
jgi:hypothetical protein